MSARASRRPATRTIAAAGLAAALAVGAVDASRAQTAGSVPTQVPPPSHAPHVAAPRAALPEAAAGSLAVRWVLVADRLSVGIANPQVIASITMAMHDALNAAEPRFRRWRAAAAGEPPGAGASAEVALSIAAFRVLTSVFPVNAIRQEAEPLLLEVLRAAEPGPRQVGLALGDAVGVAISGRVAAPPRVVPFPVGDQPGQWRPTPPFFHNGMIAEIPPILFAGRDEVRGPPPPARGSARYLADLEEVRHQGAFDSATRSEARTEAAEYWAAQSSQRGFLHLALRLLKAEPLAGGLWEEARLLSILATSLADSSALAWEEKRVHAHWRPITAIHAGGEGVRADPQWQPLLLTPPHPDYPSGHASDCGAGAAVLGGLFGVTPREVVYVAMEPMDQPRRRFPSFDAAAEECAESRVWAGAHFRFANDEGLRIGRAIAARALQAVPPVAGEVR